MFRSYYGLSFNPFDKQNAKEKDRFLSKDISDVINLNGNVQKELKQSIQTEGKQRKKIY